MKNKVRFKDGTEVDVIDGTITIDANLLGTDFEVLQPEYFLSDVVKAVNHWAMSRVNEQNISDWLNNR